MSAYDWFAVGAVLALLLLIGWHCAGPRTPTDQAAWNATTGVRTEADVQADRADARRALDLATCIAIWDITPHDIPHQTRRTEEDQ